jgi:Transcriptional Coactivator p15 (PC4)
MSARKPTLDDPVIVSQEWINRRHDALTITLTTYNGTNLVDLRKYAMNREGKLVPTPKGISIKVTRLPDLLKAITKAAKQARDLGLIDDENGDGGE